jgi:hypothetical protein
LFHNDGIDDVMARYLSGQKCFASNKVYVGEFHEPPVGHRLSPFVFHDAAFWPDGFGPLRGARGSSEAPPRPFVGILRPAGVAPRRTRTGCLAYPMTMAQTWPASPAALTGEHEGVLTSWKVKSPLMKADSRVSVNPTLGASAITEGREALAPYLASRTSFTVLATREGAEALALITTITGH